MQIKKCKNETLYSFKGGKCIIVYFEVNKKDLCKKRETGTLTGVSVAILSHHTAFRGSATEDFHVDFRLSQVLLLMICHARVISVAGERK